MLFDDLKTYFEKFITQYKPYKNISLYRELLTFLLDRYLKDSYNNLPSDFKEAFERQIIPNNFIDFILLSNGFSKSIISKISSNDKRILLNTLMDFNQYKGSLKLVTKIAQSFNQNVNIYELYIDFRSNDWVFIPKPIHISESIQTDLITTTLDFDSTISSVNNFLITKNQLSDLKSKNNICLPIKTNLLFMDIKDIEKGDTILNLFSSIILKEFRNELITLFFDNATFVLSLENVYKLWNYINIRFVNSSIVFTHTPVFPFIVFDIDHPNLGNFSVADIPTLENEFLGITTTDKISNFYFEKIFSILKVNRSWNVNTSVSDLETTYRNQMGNDIIDFVNEVIDSTTISAVQKKANILKLFDSINNSLITWSILNNKNIDYFIDSLSKFGFSAKENSPFLVLDNLKPFHTEIIVQSGKILRVKDIFNSAIVDHKITLDITATKTSVMVVSDKLTSTLTLPINTNVHEISHLQNIIFQISPSETLNILSDTVNFIFNHENHSIMNISHNFNFILTPP